MPNFYIVDGDIGFCLTANIDVRMEGLLLIGCWAYLTFNLKQNTYRKTNVTKIYMYSLNMNIKYVAIYAFTFSKHL
jgi:hypothetical protein